MSAAKELPQAIGGFSSLELNDQGNRYLPDGTTLVRIPTPLRKLTNEQDTVVANGSSGTVAELIDALEGQYPGLKERLCDETGELRRFINVYVNGEDVRFLSGLKTAVESGSEVSIVPAVAGGGASLNEANLHGVPLRRRH